MSPLISTVIFSFPSNFPRFGLLLQLFFFIIHYHRHHHCRFDVYSEYNFNWISHRTSFLIFINSRVEIKNHIEFFFRWKFKFASHFFSSFRNTLFSVLVNDMTKLNNYNWFFVSCVFHSIRIAFSYTMSVCYRSSFTFTPISMCELPIHKNNNNKLSRTEKKPATISS